MATVNHPSALTNHGHAPDESEGSFHAGKHLNRNRAIHGNGKMRPNELAIVASTGGIMEHSCYDNTVPKVKAPILNILASQRAPRPARSNRPWQNDDKGNDQNRCDDCRNAGGANTESPAFEL
jgi:hypothetical protein